MRGGGRRRATVVQLHGLGSSRASEAAAGFFDWSPVQDAGRRLVRYDARGHGRSTGRPEPDDWAWPRPAEDLFALLDVVAPGETVDAIGVSMGRHAAALPAARLESRDHEHPGRDPRPRWAGGRLPPLTPLEQDQEAASARRAATTRVAASVRAASNAGVLVRRGDERGVHRRHVRRLDVEQQVAARADEPRRALRRGPGADRRRSPDVVGHDDAVEAELPSEQVPARSREEKSAGVPGSIREYSALETMTNAGARRDPGAERLQTGRVDRGHRVDRVRAGVGVRRDAAEAREVLHRGVDAGGPASPPRTRRRARPPSPDRRSTAGRGPRSAGCRAGRPRRARPRPARGRGARPASASWAPQRSRVRAGRGDAAVPLVDRARDGREPGPGQDLDEAALLVRGGEQRQPVGRGCADRRERLRDRGGAGAAPAPDHDAGEVVPRDRRRRGPAAAARCPRSSAPGRRARPASFASTIVAARSATVGVGVAVGVGGAVTPITGALRAGRGRRGPGRRAQPASSRPTRSAGSERDERGGRRGVNP